MRVYSTANRKTGICNTLTLTFIFYFFLYDPELYAH